MLKIILKTNWVSGLSSRRNYARNDSMQLFFCKKINETE